MKALESYGLHKRCSCGDGKTKDVKQKTWKTCPHDYHAKFVLPDKDGVPQRYRPCLKTSSYTAALEAARKARDEQSAINSGIKPEVVDVMDLDELIKRYTAFIKADHPATATDDIRVLDDFKQDIGRKTLINKITTLRITKWRDGRIGTMKTRTDGKKGRIRKRTTVQRQMHVIFGLFRQAVIWSKDTGLTVNPCDALRGKKGGLKSDETPARTARPDELAMLKDAPVLIRLLQEITATNLARLSELAYISADDLLPDTLQIQVRRKGGDAEKIRVTAPQMKELQKMVNRKHQPYVFFPDVKERRADHTEPAKGGAPSQKALSMRIGRWWRRRGVVGLTHHKMRHTGATAMLNGHANPKAVMKAGNWTTMRMLERYGHSSDVAEQQCIDIASNNLKTARKKTSSMKLVKGRKHAA